MENNTLSHEITRIEPVITETMSLRQSISDDNDFKIVEVKSHNSSTPLLRQWQNG